MPELGKHFTVIAPDMRGVGETTITSEGFDKKTLSNDVNELIKKLGYEKINLVGYDLGGGVAYSFAAQFPEKVQKLAIMEFALAGYGLESGLIIDSNTNSNSNWHMALFQLPEIVETFMGDQKADLLTWMFWHISCDPLAVTAEDFNIYLKSISRQGAFRAGIGYYSTLFKDMENNKKMAAQKLKMPVLAVGGECSGGPHIAQLLSPVVEKVTPVVIKGAGHWLTDENPKALTEELIKFFKK